MDLVPEDGNGVARVVAWFGFEVELGEAGEAVKRVSGGGAVVAGEGPGWVLGAGVWWEVGGWGVDEMRE
jgi:hypothetical protein